ncbi:MAG: Gfo/Idh/MocA family oxidoreductase [Pirellulales bacterium]|nr:Gfo/Idh/MocA family oxidoreductase [Pirellulales bacterium]
MTQSTRRTFIKQSGTVAATTLALATSPMRAYGANERVTVGVIGCGGQGNAHLRSFAAAPAAEIVCVCDPDDRRRRAAREKSGVKCDVVDLRHILDNKSIDAISIATPDHWHAPAAILACEAGKHIYVEKTCTHNIREGRLLTEAARRNKCVVQQGTQCRSAPFMIEAMKRLRDGIIGDVLAAKAWNIQRRSDIGHAKPSNPPPGLDYDMWVGPAPMVPYQDNRLHGNWHWWYNFGTGGIGNDGVHDLDYAVWGLGVDVHPSGVFGPGGMYVARGDQEFPDTQTVVFEYPGDGKAGNRRMLTYEQRLWSTNYPYNVDSGVEFYGTKGQLFLSRRAKAQLLGERNKRLDADLPLRAPDVTDHVNDFVDAVRHSRRPNADIEIANRTAMLVHTGNIATRVGRSLRFDSKQEIFVGDDEANKFITGAYRKGHWAVPKGV